MAELIWNGLISSRNYNIIKIVTKGETFDLEFPDLGSLQHTEIRQLAVML